MAVSNIHYRKAAASLLGFTPYEVVESRLLNGGLGDVAKTSSVVAAGASTVASVATIAAAAGTAAVSAAAAAGTSASLFAVAAASSAVPVIGWVAAAVAVAAGFIAKGFAKAKAIKETRKEVQVQNLELSTLAAELDNNISELNLKRSSIYAALNNLGLNQNLSGLNGLLANIFTPGKVEEKKLNNATDENKRLNDEVNKKIAILEALQNDFKSIQDTFVKASTEVQKAATTKSNIETGVIIGGSALILGSIAYLILSKKSKS